MTNTWKSLSPRVRCLSVTSAILIVGLGSSVAVYLSADEKPLDPFAEFESSKKFAHELGRMGGKAAIVANDLNKWFVDLWRGETLAYTIAVITVFVAALYYFIESGLDPKRDSGGDVP